MTWAQWDDLFRCAEIFRANEEPIPSSDTAAILDRRQLNNAEQELWDGYLAKM